MKSDFDDGGPLSASSYPLSIRVRGRLLDFSRPRVMGILNATPDSFYAASRVGDDVCRKAELMLCQGADILDIGACSTRPGSDPVDEDMEWQRLDAVLDPLRSRFPDALISIDTFRASVADKCISKYNVDIINDISGGDLDPDIIPVVAQAGVPYIAMHMRGTPDTMQSLTDYEDVTAEVFRDLAFKIDKCHSAGIHDVIIDPGFGFAKTVEQNYRLLADLPIFRELGAPILVGMSRKSMLCRPLGITPDQAGDASLAIHTMALDRGALIIRVHDVAPAAQAVRLFDFITKAGNSQQFSISRSFSPRIPVLKAPNSNKRP